MNVLLMYEPAPEHCAALQEAAPRAKLMVARDETAAAQLIADADAVLGNRYFLQSLPFARSLRWMQSNSVGVDLILAAADALDNVVLTATKGIYDDEISEHAVAMAMALARGIHHARDDQRAGRWTRSELSTLKGKRTTVLGWGGVGRGIARRLDALGMQVVGVRRQERGRPAPDESGFMVWGPSTWRSVLPTTDLLLMALPLTAQTRLIVGENELAALPPHAFVVNVGRGGTLDERALLALLRAGSLRGAALDVTETEPLPPDHELRSEPSLLVTPHTARSLERPPYRWEPLFVENLRRFHCGEPLLNVVDREAGY